MTRYEVRDQHHQTVSTHRSENVAIKAAKKIEGSRVIMQVKSGTYESSMCIYPELGSIYSN